MTMIEAVKSHNQHSVSGRSRKFSATGSPSPKARESGELVVWGGQEKLGISTINKF